jgi:O-antigen/teichoic acid export membrane protein
MSDSRKLAKWTTVVFAGTIITILMSYVLRLVLARQLSLEEYGLLYAVSSFAALFNLVKDPGLSSAVTKYVAEFFASDRRGQAKYVILLAAGIQAIIGVAILFVLVGLAGNFASGFFKSQMAEAILIVFAVEYLIGISTLRSALQGLKRMTAYAVSEPLRIFVILVLVSTVLPKSALGASLGYLIAGVFTTAWIGASVVYYTRGSRMQREPGLFRKVSSFSAFVFLGSVAGYIVSYTDVLTLTYFRSLGEVGIYQAAFPTSQALWIFAGAIGAVLLPAISELWAKKKEKEIAEGMNTLLRLAFAAIIPFALVFVSYPDIVLRLLFGETYVAGAPALQVLAVGAIFYNMFSILAAVLIGIGKPANLTKITAIYATLNFVVNLVTIPTFGIMGAASATLLAYMVGFVLTSKSVGKDITIRMPGMALAKLFAGGVLTTAVIAGLKGLLVMEAVSEAIVTMAIGLVIYILYAFLTKSVTKKDLDLLRHIGVPIPTAVMRFAERLS